MSELEPTGQLPNYGEVFKDVNDPANTAEAATQHGEVASSAAADWEAVGAEHTAKELADQAEESQSQSPESPEAPAA